MVQKKLAFLILFFSLLLIKAQVFQWKNPNLPKDSLKKKDSIIASKLNKDYFKRDTLSIIKQDRPILYDDAVLAKNQKKEIFGNLNSKGSIIRGVTFGNNQGSSVQSSMDLQISGKLSKDVTLLASLTDHNLPIQADGYTQSLQEFDRIYLQLNVKDNTILRAGHLDLTNDTSFFGKYQRRTMGLQAQTFWGNHDGRTDAMISIGVARSEFRRMRFQGIEGNQGPYRLTGKNGELFISIISGSEQVFIDGILMKRGENQDYIINYNTGEITFTSFRPILRQNFITVSYNYTQQNYSRYLVTAGAGYQNEKFKIKFDAFLENDSKNSPLSQNLSADDIIALQNAGNNQDAMYAPSGVITSYDVNKVLYRKVQNTYFEYSTDATQTLYTVDFTYFGTGKGDYKIKQTSNNGRIFEYTGVNLGDYKAVRRLVAPVKTNVFNLASEYLLHEGKIGTDISISNHDNNLFSKIDNNQNLGFAGRFYGQKTFTKGDWKGTPMIEYQRISKNFTILDRINQVDFWRDFNLANEFNNRTQNRLIVSFNNQWKKSFINYKFNYLAEQSFYKGIKNDIEWGFKKKQFVNQGLVSYLDTKSDLQNTKFIRGNIVFDFIGKKGVWSIGGSNEYNQKYNNILNQTDVTSYNWKEVFLQKKWGDSIRDRLLIRTYFRTNDSVRNNVLTPINNIFGIKWQSEIIKNKNTLLTILGHYRRMFYKTNEFQGINQDFLIGNITYNYQFLRGGMRLQTFYELGNGQEAQREFQYLRVIDGQGVYKWTDYNGDGIQQLDEFEVAEYSDQAKYIRVYTNTVKYIPSNKNKLQAALLINPSSVFNSENNFLKRWNFNFSINSQNSFYKENKVVAWNPFSTEKNQILKSQNVLLSSQFNNTDKSGWNGSFKHIDVQNIINANFSVEKHYQRSEVINIGYFFNKNLRGDWETTYKTNNNSSQLFSSRNYLLKTISTHPKIIYNFTQALQSGIEAGYKTINHTGGAEILKTTELTGSMQWTYRKTSLRANFSFINNAFTGDSFSIVGNQMLEGLKPGKNQVWTIFWQQQINSFLQLNVNYEGRNSSSKTIHIGSVQVRASF